MGVGLKNTKFDENMEIFLSKFERKFEGEIYKSGI